MNLSEHPKYRPEDEAPLVKKTIYIRADQYAAMELALARSGANLESRCHGSDRSDLIRTLLDEHGYNQAYVDGKQGLRKAEPEFTFFYRDPSAEVLRLWPGYELVEEKYDPLTGNPAEPYETEVTQEIFRAINGMIVGRPRNLRVAVCLTDDGTELRSIEIYRHTDPARRGELKLALVVTPDVQPMKAALSLIMQGIRLGQHLPDKRVRP